jgi:ABC-type Fe3+-hydroxamate transport system substrate-binding protein
MLNLLTKLGILPQKNSPESGQRIIFLSDGRKVTVPAKPERICLRYSVYPIGAKISLSEWLTNIKLRKDFQGVETVKKHYLNA